MLVVCLLLLCLLLLCLLWAGCLQACLVAKMKMANGSTFTPVTYGNVQTTTSLVGFNVKHSALNRRQVHALP